MPVSLHKECIRSGELIFSACEKKSVSGDIIVPDICPDVLKILRVSVRTHVTESKTSGGRADVCGVADVNILYLPEDGLCGKIKAVDTSLDFSHSFSLGSEPAGEVFINAEAECEGAEAELINSRKLSVKCVLAVGVKVTAVRELEIPVGAEEGLELKFVPLKIQSPVCELSKTLVISERLELPAGKPPAAEVLKSDALATLDEVRLLDGRAAVRGEVRLSFLYNGKCDSGDGGKNEELGIRNEELKAENVTAGDGGVGEVETAEFTSVFTEVLEGTELCEGLSAETECVVCGMDCRLEDGGGVICVEARLGLTLRAFRETELRAVEDAFSVDFPTEAVTAVCPAERFLCGESVQLTRKELFELSDALPEIRRVCTVNVQPAVTDVSVADGRINLSGRLKADMLYLTHLDELPAVGAECVFELSHSLDMPCMSENAVCEAKLSASHLSYVLLGGRCVELRIICTLSVRCISVGETVLAESLNVTEGLSSASDGASVAVYFVQEGDTLWDIAKHFRISPEKLAEDNGLENVTAGTEDLRCGSAVMVVR